MLFQLRTDNHVNNSEGLGESIRSAVEAALTSRVAERLRRVEVYVQDVNGGKGGVDKRCSIEGHLTGHQPVVARGEGVSVHAAVNDAVERWLHALDHTLGRLSDGHGHRSMGGVEK